MANLRAHKLTVTQLRFSNSGEYLLSSGRDRQFSLFKRVGGETKFELAHVQAKAHDRIIWSCDWSSDDKFFITGSRDKSCKVWTLDTSSNVPTLFGKFAFKTGVTAVAFAPTLVRLEGSDEYSYLVAVGLETGLMQLWAFTAATASFACVLELPVQ